MPTYIHLGSAPRRYATHNTLHIVSFPSSSSCLVSSELTQASECLRLTAAGGSDSSIFPSFSGSWRSAFPVLRSLPRSHLNLSRCRFYFLPFQVLGVQHSPS
eukprot:TRINITY_DN2928_c1_g1_i7.p1 TRINITY_DN2928_c1_g1~~TRINITY_DN2928_c1_g1_i7.p1  ORF type:complete len:102 (+),score=0.29 TRINITY_DN2928_c1_g1_i7:314-619(+)